MGLSHANIRPRLLLGVILSCFLFLSPQTVFAVNVAFTYDAGGRLLTAQYGDGQRIVYAYDSVGNMTQQIAMGSGGGSLIMPAVLLLLDNSQSNNPYSSILNEYSRDVRLQ